MSDPRQPAIDRVAASLERAQRGPLSAEACWQLVEDVRVAPGLLRRAAQALSRQADAAAVDALLALPPGVPGVIEGVYKAMRHGIRRARRDGGACPAVLALDFRRSRAQRFDEALRRAWAVFGDGLEFLQVQGKAAYRLRLTAERGTLAGRAAAAAADVQWLHGHLGPLRGSRLWLNGWCFDGEGSVRPPAQVHLVRGWLSWAAGQTETRQ